MSETRRLFAIALRREGFRREWRDKDCTQHKKELNDRTLHVQLWIDGGHRCSFEVRGHGWVYPTDFHSIEEMASAIAFQSAISIKDEPGNNAAAHPATTPVASPKIDP